MPARQSARQAEQNNLRAPLLTPELGTWLGFRFVISEALPPGVVECRGAAGELRGVILWDDAPCR